MSDTSGGSYYGNSGSGSSYIRHETETDIEVAAIDDISKDIELNDWDYTLYYKRGYFYYQKQDYDNAIRDFNTSIEINPNCTDADAMLKRCNHHLKVRRNEIDDYNDKWDMQKTMMIYMVVSFCIGAFLLVSSHYEGFFAFIGSFVCLIDIIIIVVFCLFS
ncbi:MAG: tetratricopeptide repeat protein [Nitrospirae bacterium]|nr:tetratricopeptide repeat protein [Nitrospirota bacterium]